MRFLILSFAALASMASAIAEPSGDMEVTVSGASRRTVFLATPAIGATTAMPVLHICYDATATGSYRPEILSVHLGEEFVLLGPDECAFVAGKKVEVAVWKGDGTIRASVALVR